MATKPDPWRPVGVVIYFIMAFLVERLGLQIRKDDPMSVEYETDPEPRWMLCPSCGHSTVHLAHFWVEDGETDWECDQCGAVRYE